MKGGREILMLWNNTCCHHPMKCHPTKVCWSIHDNSPTLNTFDLSWSNKWNLEILVTSESILYSYLPFSHEQSSIWQKWGLFIPHSFANVSCKVYPKIPKEFEEKNDHLPLFCSLAAAASLASYQGSLELTLDLPWCWCWGTLNCFRISVWTPGPRVRVCCGRAVAVTTSKQTAGHQRGRH